MGGGGGGGRGARLERGCSKCKFDNESKSENQFGGGGVGTAKVEGWGGFGISEF